MAAVEEEDVEELLLELGPDDLLHVLARDVPESDERVAEALLRLLLEGERRLELLVVDLPRAHEELADPHRLGLHRADEHDLAVAQVEELGEPLVALDPEGSPVPIEREGLDDFSEAHLLDHALKAQGPVPPEITPGLPCGAPPRISLEAQFRSKNGRNQGCKDHGCNTTAMQSSASS